MATSHCCQDRRLAAVRAAGVLNGIDHLEVSDTEAPTQALRQRTLFVRLLAPAALTADNVAITGGDRIRDIAVEWVAPATALPAGEDPALVANLRDPDEVVVVRVDQRGDHAPYRLALVAGASSDQPPAGFDPLLAAVDFGFKVECPSDLDCRTACTCTEPAAPGPVIDYLAKDWATFRRLMLDRLSLAVPDWTERSVADVGVTLVEVLAWLGDEVSYRQDAAATEAWIGTARLRSSLRRHARLVDHVVDEGRNARVWAAIEVTGDGVVVPAGTPLLTATPDVPAVVAPGSRDHVRALARGATTFEVVVDTEVHASTASFELWTWGDGGCCLPVGATAATLRGHHPRLRAGDVVVLEEVVGPRTGHPEDADPAHRAAVRLTSVVDAVDPSGGLFEDPPHNGPVDVTEVTWDETDALPFPLCVSVEEQPGVAIATVRGNVVLADHGRTVVDEVLGSVPAPVLALVGVGGGPCDPATPQAVRVRWRPVLAERNLTHAGPAPAALVAVGSPGAGVFADLAVPTFGPDLQVWLTGTGVSFDGDVVVRGADGRWSVGDGTTIVTLVADGPDVAVWGRPAAATTALVQGPAGPAVSLVASTATGDTTWLPRTDLLASGPDAREFVVEMAHDRRATLRFGDGDHGQRPDTDTTFTATYRVGNGPSGAIGAGALAHVVTDDLAILGVANPVPAAGARAPETPDAIRRDAPQAFRVQQRAVTLPDHEARSDSHPAVQRTAATMRWTGSWHTVFLTVDPVGGGRVDPVLEAAVRAHLEPWRMAGLDLEVDDPVPVALDVGLHVCAAPDHFREAVHAAVLDVLTAGLRSDGHPGLFHPDNFVFDQDVFLSPIVAAAQDVAGVASVTVTRFGRLAEPDVDARDEGVVAIGRLEVAQLDQDPTFPDRGRLVVTMGGGK